MTTEMEPAPLDLTAYTRPEQLERLGPQRLQSALKWLGYGGDDMPKNSVQLARRLFATRGIPPERLTADFFDKWVDEYKYTEPQFLDLRNITSITQLEELGNLRLKAASKALGIKCAGTLQMMAQRLFATRGIPREKWPADFFPTKHGQRSTSKKRKEAKLFPSYMTRPDANQKIIMPTPSAKGGQATKNTGWNSNKSSRSNLNLPPPPPPPLPSSPPPPPPPPPRSSGATQGGQSNWSQSSNYGNTQSASLSSAAYTTTTVSTAASVATSWPGQNYPPPSEQLYNYHAFPQSTYQPGSVVGFTYGFTTGAASGYTSTGTYIQPSSTASSISLYTTLAGTTTTPAYSVQSSASGSTYTTGASTGTYAYTPAAQSGTGYTSQSASTGSAGNYGYGTQSVTSSNQQTTSSYDVGSSSYDTGTSSYDTGDTGYGTGDTRYDNDDTSYNTGDNNYDTSYNTDDNRYNNNDNWDSSKSVGYTTKDWKTTSNLDDTGTPNSWAASYGNWDRADDRSTAGTSNTNTGRQSRWSSAETTKGVTVGKGTTGSKFKMMQCKDCNIFLSTDEQYKKHMVSEQHILKVGGDLSEVQDARNAQQQMDRQRFHPYSRPGGRQDNQQTEMSQKTINEIEEEKWRMYAMRYEVKLTDSRDPGGLGRGRFGKIGKRRAGTKARERRDQMKTRRMKEQSGKVTRSDDEDDIYRRLPSQLEHRGLGYVEHSRFEAPKDIKLDTFVKKGQLHMDTGMRWNKYIRRKQEEEMGAPALPESGVPQFGAAPPPVDYDMPRQSLRPRGIGLKDRNEPVKITFDTPEDIMRAAIVIPLLVPHLEIPGMDKIKQALFLSANPRLANQDAALQNQDMLAAAKDVVSTLKEGNQEKKGDENQEQEMEGTEGDKEAEATSNEKETQPKIKSLLDLDLSQGSTSMAGGPAGQDPQIAASANQEPTNDAEDPAKNKLLSNLSSVYDKPDVLQNPAVLNFLAQAQPAAIAKVKPTKPILKKLPPAVIDEIIYEAQMIAEQMDRQMQEALDITLAQLYGGPGILGETPHKRRRFDDWDDGYFGDDDYDDYGDGYNDDLYDRRFGFGDFRDERRMEEEAFRRNFNRRRREFDYRRGVDFDGPWDFDGPRDDFYDPREFYGRRLYDASQGEIDEYSNYRRKRMRNKLPGDDDDVLPEPEPETESPRDDYMERKIKERQLQQQRQANKKKRQKESKSKDKEEENDDSDDADATPSRPLRSALPPQLLGMTEADLECNQDDGNQDEGNQDNGNQDDNQDEGKQDDYMQRKAKERQRQLQQQKQKQGNKKRQKESKTKDKEEEKDDVDDADETPSRPLRSALPAQLLAALADSSSPAEKDQSETVQNKDGDKSDKKDAEKKQSPKSKGKSDEKMDENSEPSRPLRSAIPAQLLNEMNKQPESSKKIVAKEDAGTKDNSKPSHPVGGSGPGGKKSKAASKGGSQEKQQSQSANSVENMEVDKQVSEPESKKIKSPEMSKGAFKSFKIPKKQTPAAKKGNEKSGSHPVRSAIPPQLLGGNQKSSPSGGAQSHSKDSKQAQQPKGQESKDITDKSKDEGQEKKQKKPTSTTSEANAKKAHPIRSALPAQLLAGIDKEGATGDDDTSSTSSKTDAKTEKAKKMGLPTEDYGQKKGGGPMKRRVRKSPRT